MSRDFNSSMKALARESAERSERCRRDWSRLVAQALAGSSLFSAGACFAASGVPYAMFLSGAVVMLVLARKAHLDGERFASRFLVIRQEILDDVQEATE